MQWYLENFDASDEELLEALIQRIKGPDFPTYGQIVGRRGIEEAYRTGRGSITMRAVIDIEEDRKGRTNLVVTELPYQVNPDNLAAKIDEMAKDGRIAGIAAVQELSSRPDRPAAGHRAQARRRGQGRAEQPVQTHPAAGHVRRQHARAGRRGAAHTAPGPDRSGTGSLTRSKSIVRRTQYLLRKAQERAHILSALIKAIDQIDAVIALIRASASAAVAQTGLMELLEIDEIQAQRDPGHAAAQARRARAAAAHRRVRRADGADRRLRGDPGLAGAAASDHRHRARGDRRASTATTGAPSWSPTTATSRWPT